MEWQDEDGVVGGQSVMLDPKKQVLEGAFQTFIGGSKMLIGIGRLFQNFSNQTDARAPALCVCDSDRAWGPVFLALPSAFHFMDLSGSSSLELMAVTLWLF